MIIAAVALLAYIAIAITWIGVALLIRTRRTHNAQMDYLNASWANLRSLDQQVSEIKDILNFGPR